MTTYFWKEFLKSQSDRVLLQDGIRVPSLLFQALFQVGISLEMLEVQLKIAKSPQKVWKELVELLSLFVHISVFDLCR